MTDTAPHNSLPPSPSRLAPSRLPSSRSKDARAVRSAAALREALLTLLAQRAFDQITIRDICAQAGVHYATFFRHHPSKESLLDLTAREQIARLNELAMAIRGSGGKEGSGGDYLAGFTALCTYVDSHRDLFATLLNGGAGGAMREEWVRQSRLVAATENHADGWLPPELGTICAATLTAETLAWWVAQPKGALGVDEIAAIMHRLIAQSLIAPA